MKRTAAAASISISTPLVIAMGDVTSSADAAALLDATPISNVDGRRLCRQCDTWKSLESYNKWSRICRTCWAAALR